MPERLFRFVTSLGLFALISCATPPTAQTPKDRKYEQLKAQINAKHDSALFSSSAPTFFTKTNAVHHFKKYARLACPQWPKPDQTSAIQECTRIMGLMVSDSLAKKYYAVTADQVAASCQKTPFICQNLFSFEGLFRKLHNSAIEKSREAKMERLKDWRAGRISYATLKQDIGPEAKPSS